MKFIPRLIYGLKNIMQIPYLMDGKVLHTSTLSIF
jgi:hypothetical protein